MVTNKDGVIMAAEGDRVKTPHGFGVIQSVNIGEVRNSFKVKIEGDLVFPDSTSFSDNCFIFFSWELEPTEWWKVCVVCRRLIKMVSEDDTWWKFDHCGIPQSVYKKGLNKRKKKQEKGVNCGCQVIPTGT